MPKKKVIKPTIVETAIRAEVSRLHKANLAFRTGPLNSQTHCKCTGSYSCQTCRGVRATPSKILPVVFWFTDTEAGILGPAISMEGRDLTRTLAMRNLRKELTELYDTARSAAKVKKVSSDEEEDDQG